MNLAASLLLSALASAPNSDPSASELTPPSLIEDVPVDSPTDHDEDVEVLLALVIDTKGAVIEVRVLESGGAAFDARARQAARRFRFSPAYEGDTAIEVEIEYLYVFEGQVAENDGIDETDTIVLRREPRQAAESAMDGDEGERVPGGQGDAVKAAQALGGVGRPALGTGELVLWGAAPSDTRRQVDWIMVPRLFHVGGGGSILPSARVQTVRVTPGGFGPAYGRALGGLVIVSTKGRPAREGVGGFARLDPINVGGGVDTVVVDKGYVSLAARRSILTQTYGRVAPASSRAVVPLPQSWDYQAKGEVELRGGTTLEILGLGAEDHLERSIPTTSADRAFAERSFSGFHRLGARMRWQAQGSTSEVATWFGVDRSRLRQDFSEVDVLSAQDVWRGGLRLGQTRGLNRVLALRWGVDAEIARAASSRDGALTLPAREGDVVAFGQPPGDRVAEDRWHATQASIGAYVGVPLTWASGRWQLEPSLRLEPSVAAGDRILPVRAVEPQVGYANVDVAWLPRGRIRWTPLDPISVFAAGGQYAQQPDPADLSAVFGNPRLRSARAEHAVAGVQTHLGSRVDLDATGFFIRSRRRAGRTDSPTPPTAELLQSKQDGRSFGGQMVARVRPTDQTAAHVVYAWSRAQRRDPGRTTWRLFDFDQTHLLQAMASWRHRTGVELGGRCVLTSGFPRTAVVDARYDARQGRWDPLFGEHNAVRLPMFFELSARVGYVHEASWGSVHTWLDLQNATHRANASEWFYSADYGQRARVRGLPILPLLGVEVRT